MVMFSLNVTVILSGAVALAVKVGAMPSDGASEYAARTLS